MLDTLTTLFTVLFAENALFVFMYGADELDRLTEDGRKNALLALGFFVSTLITEISVFAIGRFLLPNGKDSFIIIIPIVSFFVMCVLMLLLNRVKPSLCSEIKPLAPVFALNTASAGIIYGAAVSVQSFSDSFTLAFFTTAASVLSFALFASLKERIISARLPSPLKGVPILLITAGLVTMILSGFTSMRF